MADDNKYLKSLKDAWPSSLVARSHVGRFSGGVLTSRSMANLDSQGKGPARIRIGRIVAYPIDEFIEWLNERIVEQ